MNLPATLKEYCLEVDIDYDEDRDKQNEELYKDMTFINNALGGLLIRRKCEPMKRRNRYLDELGIPRAIYAGNFVAEKKLYRMHQRSRYGFVKSK